MHGGRVPDGCGLGFPLDTETRDDVPNPVAEPHAAAEDARTRRTSTTCECEVTENVDHHGGRGARR
ncbi:hypothetical protein ADK67_06175 [Saccharothrix sp. NRRL B-16348]|nr:hypothetical protein ADK67_06175 [Saccharothrix sp. NRRL B-16348]